MAQDETGPHLAIVGGGLTGAALAIHLMQAGQDPLVIDVIEPAEDLGRGAAYGTVDPAHRINVPTGRMSLFGADRGHFTRWLVSRGTLPDPASTDVRGDHYVARSAFGAYVGDVLASSLAAAKPRVVLRHRRARAVAIALAGEGWRVALDDGGTLRVDGVALCPGHPAPIPPCPISEAARRHPGLVAHPWRRDAYAGIAPDASVLIVGTGLTMLDALASLTRDGHQGPICAVSRRGLMARPQGGFRDDVDPFADAPLPRTAVALLAILKAGLRRHAPEVGWPVVADAFRARLAPLWAALPPEEQRRVVRRLLPFWEVHRFRAAPQPYALAEHARAAGRLTVRRAGLKGLAVDGDRLEARLGLPGGGVARRSFDAVVICTGPAGALRADPLVGDLVAEGLGRPDAVGLGLAVDGASRLAKPGGRHHATLWALGPVTRGSFGEMTGEPDIVRHIAAIVPGVLEALTTARSRRTR